MYPFLLLVFLQLIVPEISFVGHLSGVIGGMLIVFGCVYYLFPSQASMIIYFEIPDSILYEIAMLCSYVRVNTNRAEGFINNDSGIDSSLIRSAEGCCNCNRFRERCLCVFDQCKRYISACLPCSDPSHEYGILPTAPTPTNNVNFINGSNNSDDANVLSQLTSASSACTGDHRHEAAVAEKDADELRAIRVAKFSK